MEEENMNQNQEDMEAEEGLQAEKIEENGGDDDIDYEDDPVWDIECMRFFQPDDDEDEDEEEEDEEEEVEDEDKDEEEEEDVDSDGECDEEVQKVVDDLLMKERARLEKITLQGTEEQKTMDTAAEQPAEKQPVAVPQVAVAPLAPPTQLQPIASSSSQRQTSTPAQVEIVYRYNKPQLWMKCPRRPNLLPSNVKVVDVQDPNAPKDMIDIARNTIRMLGLSPDKDFVEAFNEHFVLAICYSNNPHEKFFCRFHPRNFLFDPPIYEEFVDIERFVSEADKERFVLQTKYKYPEAPYLSYALLRYMEDPYWFQQRPIPNGVVVPPQPVDFEERKRGSHISVQTLYTMVTGDTENVHEFMSDCVQAMIMEHKQKRVPCGFDLSCLTS